MSEPRCLGIDPGSAHPAWGVVGGRPEEVIGWGMLDAADPTSSLTGLLRVYEPDVIAFEIVEGVHPRRRRGPNGVLIVGMSTDEAFALYRTGVLTGELRREAITQREAIDGFSAETWRAALIGVTNPDAEAIETTLRRRLLGFPAPRKSNGHHRDALGAALFGLLRFRSQQQPARAS